MVLVSEKPVEINGKTRDEYWFGAIIIQRGYVGFYFMPVRDAAEKKEVFKPELLKCLKGKSCFHIKKGDAEIFKQIKKHWQKDMLNARKKVGYSHFCQLQFAKSLPQFFSSLTTTKISFARFLHK